MSKQTLTDILDPMIRIDSVTTATTIRDIANKQLSTISETLDDYISSIKLIERSNIGISPTYMSEKLLHLKGLIG